MATQDETTSLLVRSSVPAVRQSENEYKSGTNSTTIPVAVTTSSNMSGSGSGNKPILTRQECTTILNSSGHPQLSVFSDSEEDGSGCSNENSRSVPDIEMHCRLDVKNCRNNNSISENPTPRNRPSPTTYQFSTPTPIRNCTYSPSGNENTDRRSGHTPSSILKIDRSISKESVRSAHHCMCHCMNTQSSQPEAASTGGFQLQHGAGSYGGSSSMRHLRDERSDTGGGIAGIAADSLRINGAMRNFKQGLLLCPQQTMAQSRRMKFKRAFTEVTNDTVNYVRTVGY